MTVRLIDLTDRIVTDSGEVVAKYDLLVNYAWAGKPLNTMRAEPHKQIATYNSVNKDKLIAIWNEDGELQGPAPNTLEWNIPQQYLDLDVIEHVNDRMARLGIDDTRYLDRLAEELVLMQERNMFPFIQCLIYIRDVLKENRVVLGVGRGSACASLVLFVLGIHRVDPVLYDIPIEEFLK